MFAFGVDRTHVWIYNWNHKRQKHGGIHFPFTIDNKNEKTYSDHRCWRTSLNKPSRTSIEIANATSFLIITYIIETSQAISANIHIFNKKITIK